jgi:Tfp pilus assembly protein PilF
VKKIAAAVRGAAFLACFIGLGAAHAQDGFGDPFADDAPSAPASGGGGSGDGDFNIDALFGTFQAEEEKKPDDAPKRVLPPFTGTYKVLISRPIYAVYEAETKTKWISALGEIYMHYKIGAFPRTQVFTMEQVSNVLPNSRDYARRFNRQHYLEAARKLGATHLIYQEYQPQKDGRKTRYAAELYWIQEGAAVERVALEIPHNDLEGGLNNIAGKLAEAMDPAAKTSAAMGISVWGKDAKTFEQFGNALAGEGNFTKDNALAAYAAVDRMIQKNTGPVGYQYAGALLAGRAESFPRAIKHMETVISRTKDYPALQLRLAEYMRGAGRYSEAMRAAETAAQNPALRVPASIEIAMIHQSQGNLDRARSAYDALMQSGDADGRVLFQLALLSIQTGRIGESEEYLRRAEESGFALDEGEYFDLGQAYAGASGNEEKGIEFLKRSMGVKQSNEAAWGLIADIYNRMGNSQLEADSYVNMFKINMQGNSGRLKTAGEIYEKLGMTDKAKDAYSLFLDRRFADAEVAMSLGRIYYNEKNEKNCNRMREVLKGLDTIPEAVQMLSDCGFKVRLIDASQTMKTKKLSPLMLTLRISGGAFLVGGLTGGLVINGVVLPDKVEKYQDWKPSPSSDDDGPKPAQNPATVKQMRKEIDNNVLLRNTLYALAGVGLGGFAVTYFF